MILISLNCSVTWTWEAHELENYVIDNIKSAEVKTLKIVWLITTTEIANEVFDTISKLRIAPEGL